MTSLLKQLLKFKETRAIPDFISVEERISFSNGVERGIDEAIRLLSEAALDWRKNCVSGTWTIDENGFHPNDHVEQVIPHKAKEWFEQKFAGLAEKEGAGLGGESNDSSKSLTQAAIPALHKTQQEGDMSPILDAESSSAEKPMQTEQEYRGDTT